MKNQNQTISHLFLFVFLILFFGCKECPKCQEVGQNSSMQTGCNYELPIADFAKKYASMEGGKNATLTVNELIVLSLMQEEDPDGGNKKEIARLEEAYQAYRANMNELIIGDIGPKCPIQSHWFPKAFDNIILDFYSGYDNPVIQVLDPDGNLVTENSLQNSLFSSPNQFLLYQMQQKGKFPDGDEVTVVINCSRDGEVKTFKCKVPIKLK